MIPTAGTDVSLCHWRLVPLTIGSMSTCPTCELPIIPNPDIGQNPTVYSRWSVSCEEEWIIASSRRFFCHPLRGHTRTSSHHFRVFWKTRKDTKIYPRMSLNGFEQANSPASAIVPVTFIRLCIIISIQSFFFAARFWTKVTSTSAQYWLLHLIFGGVKEHLFTKASLGSGHHTSFVVFQEKALIPFCLWWLFLIVVFPSHMAQNLDGSPNNYSHKISLSIKAASNFSVCFPCNVRNP